MAAVALRGEHATQMGVGHTQLAGEYGFGHGGHAVHVGAVLAHAAGFGGGGQPRALHAGVNRRFVRRHTALADQGEQLVAQGVVVGVGEIGVGVFQRAAFDKAAFAAVGVVDQIVRQQQFAGAEAVVQRAHGGYRHDAAHADAVQRPDIGAVVDQLRGDGVVQAVSAEKHHRPAADFAFQKRGAGLAVGGADDAPRAGVPLRQPRQTGAADNCECVHGQSCAPPEQGAYAEKGKTGSLKAVFAVSGCLRGGGKGVAAACRLSAVLLEKIGEHVVAVFGEQPFGVELHAFDGEVFVAHAHDFVIFCPCGDF